MIRRVRAPKLGTTYQASLGEYTPGARWLPLTWAAGVREWWTEGMARAEAVE
jgi:hypothetical protein